MDLTFGNEEINLIQEKYKECWWHINVLRLERELQEERKKNVNLQSQIHSMGPQPNSKEPSPAK